MTQAALARIDAAGVVRLGDATLGTWRRAYGPRPASRSGRRARLRLDELAAVLAVRRRDGVLTPPEGAALVAADVLIHAGLRGRLTFGPEALGVVLAALLERPTADEAAIALERAVASTRLMPASAAGLALGFTLDELAGVEALLGRVVVTLDAVDEPNAARRTRRQERARAQTAARNRKYRRSLKIQAENGVTTAMQCCKTDRDAPYCGDGASRRIATLPPQPRAVAQAIAGGAATCAAICAATALPASTVRPLLARLLRAGAVAVAVRGTYRVALSAGDEA